MQHGVRDTARKMRSRWRIVIAILVATCACFLCLVVGTWLVLQVSGAREEFTTIVNGGFRMDASGSLEMVERLYLPMLGVQGCAAIVSGLCVGLVAGRKSASAAIIGISPLYVLTFATGLTTKNAVWAFAYAVSGTTAAYVIGRKT